MKKCLLFVALLIVSQLNNLMAQTLFNAPDTVCIKQPVTLTSNFPNADSYYWGFCSGYLMNPPSGGSNLGGSFSFQQPSAIDVVRDFDNNYYGFVLNNATQEFLKLSYGTSLLNIPTITNMGNVTGILPAFPTSFYIVRDTTSSNWFIFVAGGTDQASSTLGRLDFGASLNNPRPNVANFGNMLNALNVPKGLFVGKQGNNWIGYVVNNGTSDLVRLDFEKNVSNTPLAYSEGTLSGAISAPSDMAVVFDQGNWYLFVTNLGNNSLTRIDLGNYLGNTTPIGNVIGNLGVLTSPSAISVTKDCGSYYAYITNQATNELVAVDMPFVAGPYTATSYSNAVGGFGFSGPTAISRVIRYHDNLYAFVANGDNTLSRVAFPQCTQSTIQSSTSANPPTYVYLDSGTYNIYNVINEGEPTMQVECQLIYVSPPPNIDLSSDTMICQGDTVTLRAVTADAMSTIWYPDYNLSDTSGQHVKVWPAYALPYHVVLSFPDGCIVDTPVYVNVSKVKADAGPDRTIADGSKTILGGPLTTTDGLYQYSWTPPQFLSDTTTTNPVSSPAYDFTYYLRVTELNDTLRCSSQDTIVIHTSCADLYLPNAFAPESNVGGANRFGILNREIIKLNYLRVFDRWGTKVFETTDPTQQWDGMVNGKKAESGVYVWEADGFCVSGKHFQKAGNVTLLR